MTTLSQCRLCPHECSKRPGFCGATSEVRVFRWGPHFGEEPPITGARGSGCVFFSRCTMKCAYCQNSPWSWCGKGEDKTVEQLRSIFRDLAVKDGVENWNLVSPTPYLPFIEEAVKPLFDEGVRLPFVWNSSGYERVETLEKYSFLCDCALFDLRYADEETALKYSKVKNYVQSAREAVKWAFKTRRGTGDLPGLIVRILVLPGHAEEAVRNLEWIANELSPSVPVSVMAQYTPSYKALEISPLNRVVTHEEYELVVDAAAELGFENGWVQGYEAADEALALLGENMKPGHGTVK